MSNNQRNRVMNSVTFLAKQKSQSKEVCCVILPNAQHQVKKQLAPLVKVSCKNSVGIQTSDLNHAHGCSFIN